MKNHWLDKTAIENTSLPNTSSLMFLRQFRWLLYGEHLNSQLNKSFCCNYGKKIIKLKTYEVYTPPGFFSEGTLPIQDWVNAIKTKQYPDESLLFIALLGDGKEIYRKKFTGLHIIDEAHNFDYTTSDSVDYRVILRYKKCIDEPTSDTIHAMNAEEAKIHYLHDTITIK